MGEVGGACRDAVAFWMGRRYDLGMNEIAKRIVTDEKGKPLEVVIAWDVYQDLAERMGWDLDDHDAADVREAMGDWRNGNRSAFVSLEDLK